MVQCKTLESNIMASTCITKINPKVQEIQSFKNFNQFRLPRQLIKNNDLDKVHKVCRGLLQEYFCKTFVKISEMSEYHCTTCTFLQAS